MKKVLILTVTAGFGHNSVARAVKNRLLSATDEKYEVEVIEVLKEYGKPFYYWLNKEGYAKSMSLAPVIYETGFYFSKNNYIENKTSGVHHHAALSCIEGLYKKINEYKPDVIYCSHFIPAIALSDARLVYKIPARVIMSELDYYNTPFFEAALRVDYFTLPNEDMVEENLKNGFKQDQLLVTGIPIGEHFATPLDKIETRKKLGIKEDLFTILIMFGGGEWSGITSLFKELMKSYTEEAQIIIINGRNEDSFNKIEKLETPENINVVNVGFVENIQEYMFASDIAITKAGGLSVTEMIATELPLIISEKVYAQEKENMHYLISKGMATSFSDAEDLVLKIKEVKQNYDYYVTNLRKNKRNAIEDIYKLINSQEHAVYDEEYIASIDYSKVKENIKDALKESKILSDFALDY
ncbi:MAG: hypothetical protein K5925_04235 [Bacilli bacterium]|nr:hypothetical protein [Bacilli bacterium]